MIFAIYKIFIFFFHFREIFLDEIELDTNRLFVLLDGLEKVMYSIQPR